MEGSLVSLLIGAGFDLDAVFYNNLLDDFSEGCRFTVFARVRQINCRQGERIGKDRSLRDIRPDTRASNRAPNRLGSTVSHRSRGSKSWKRLLGLGVHRKRGGSSELCRSGLGERRERIRSAFKLVSLLHTDPRQKAERDEKLKRTWRSAAERAIVFGRRVSGSREALTGKEPVTWRNKRDSQIPAEGMWL